MRRASFLMALLLTACAGQQSYDKPAIELPAAWKESAPRYAEDGRWWRIYDDSVLDNLVDESLASNADLAIAAARVDETRALLGEAESGFFPTLDARGVATRQKNSERTATFFQGIPTQYRDYRATLNVSYEVDVFGRLRAGARAPRAELDASEAARDTVRLALAAQVAKS